MTMNYNVLLSQIHIHIVNRHRWVCTTLVCPSANRVLQKKTAGHLNACLPTMQRGNGKGGGGGWHCAGSGRWKRNGAKHSARTASMISNGLWSARSRTQRREGTEQRLACGRGRWTKRRKRRWRWRWRRRYRGEYGVAEPIANI